MLPLDYSFVFDDAGLAALEPEWDSLLERSPANGIFLTWDYLRTWWEVHGGPCEPCLVTARDAAGRLRGLAPMMVGRGVTSARRHIRHLTIIGGLRESMAEYGDFIIEPEVEAEAASAFTRMLMAMRRPRWDLFYVHLARGASVAVQTLCRELGAGAGIVERKAYIATMDHSWDAFLARQSSNRRRLMRSKPQQFQKNHRTAIHHAGRDLSYAEALEHLIRLNRLRWGEESEAFHTESFIEFHRRLVPVLAARGRVSLMLLQADDHYVAARYDFLYDGRALNFQTGWDPAWAAESVGSVLLSLAVQHYIGLGTVREYDFLAGDARYKDQWSDHTAPLLTIERANPRSLRGRIFAMLSRRRAAKSAAAANRVPQAEQTAD